MRRVETVDSAGVGAIIWCLRELTTHGGHLKLCNMARRIRLLFEIMRLHTLFDIRESPTEAVLAFHES